MGYISTIRVDAVIAVQNKLSDELAEEVKALQEKAEESGISLAMTTVDSPFMEISKYLKERKDELGYWIYVEENDPEELAVWPHGESGKAYEFENELREFLRFLDGKGYSLTGVFYREGEEQGDVERFLVVDNIITGMESAELRFSDGEVYAGR